MRFSPTKLQDVILLVPDVYRDERGVFLETFHVNRYIEGGLKDVFVQDNYASSKQGALRGLHAQLRRPQAKLIRVTKGEVFDVVVDARPDSPTFGQWEGFELSDKNFNQLYVPKCFLHGYYVMSHEAVVEYKCSDYYVPKDEIGVCWNDPDLKIQWPLSEPLLSEKDAKLPFFNDLRDRFELYRSK